MKTAELYAKCESVGLLACINRIGKLPVRRYEVVIDFEVKKSYKQRQSAIKFINRKFLIMKPRTLAQNAQMHKLFGLLKLKEEAKRDLVASFSNERTESTAELTISEANELIRYLNDRVSENNQTREAHANKMRRSILACAHTMGWYVRDEKGMLVLKDGNRVLDFARIDKYCETRTEAKKPLKELTNAELHKVVFQFQQMAKNYLKR